MLDDQACSLSGSEIVRPMIDNSDHKRVFFVEKRVSEEEGASAGRFLLSFSRNGNRDKKKRTEKNARPSKLKDLSKHKDDDDAYNLASLDAHGGLDGAFKPFESSSARLSQYNPQHLFSFCFSALVSC